MDPPCPIWPGQHYESAITVAPANTAVAAIKMVKRVSAVLTLSPRSRGPSINLIQGFFQLRDQKEGYNVSLIKAGLNVMGRAVGPVRAPLINPSETHEAELKSIIDRGLSLIHPGGTLPETKKGD